MGLTTTNRQQVEEYPWGMYVWQLPDGTVLADDDDRAMNVFTTKNNYRAAAKALQEAAAHYGFPEGKAIWWSGKRRLTDEEYQEQVLREKLGLIPDPLDIGAIRDEERARKQND